MRDVAAQLGARAENALPAAEKLSARVRELERELAAAQRKLAGGATDDILANASESNGIKFVASRAPQGLDKNSLRELADTLADKLDGVVILALENRWQSVVGRQSQQSRRGCWRARGQYRESNWQR